MPESYPLHWPAGRPRTPTAKREPGRFDTTPDRARRELQNELRLMGARSIVLSSDVQLRQDGEPYASRRPPEDPGVAVYFERSGEQFAFACDRYDAVWKNIRGISKTIEALRGIERWGTGEMVRAAFSGFAALPAPDSDLRGRPWWEVLGVSRDEQFSKVRGAYRELATKHHPDNGGDPETMKSINLAWSEAKEDPTRR